MKGKRAVISAMVVFGAVVIGTFLVAQTIFANNVTSSVTVGASSPQVSAVTVNGGGSITLNNPGGTTNVSVVATISDSNGCGELTAGTTTVLLYRSGYTSSTCAGASSPNGLDCYQATLFTASSTCSAGVVNTTTTFPVQYFAHATDSSSSFSGQTWIATVMFRTPDTTTGTADSAGVVLNTLTAISLSTTTINYGTITASSTTGSTDQVTTSTNAGNSSTTLQLYAQVALTSGASVIPTSSQAFSTSTFTYPGTSTALTGSPVTVNGFLLVGPTSTTNITSPIFWGLSVPNGTATGTYSGTNVFQAVFHS